MSKTRALAVGAAAVSALALLLRDHRRARALERETALRLPAGRGGIIFGAEPALWKRSKTHAVLLVHGFGDTPQSLRELAKYLYRSGLTVELTLLPGHGRSLQEFGASRAADWIEHVRERIAALGQEYEHVSLIGQSMGAALGTIVAAETDVIQSLVLLAPYLSMPRHIRQLSRLLRISGVLAPFRRSAYGSPSIHDPIARAEALSFGVVSGRLLSELYDVTLIAEEALPLVSVPTLMLASRQDNRIPAQETARFWHQLTTPQRELRWLEGSGHVISVDYERHKVFQDTANWLERFSNA